MSVETVEVNTMQVNVLEAKNQLSHLIRLAQAGEHVLIANRGAPVAQLVPVRAAAAVSERNFVQWLDEHPLLAHAQRSAHEIDATIADERAAWD